MESLSTITAWDPPHRFVADSRDDMGPDDPTVATEWIVEARSGGTCVVRVVHSWFTSSDDWDDQFEGHTYGWISFFRILRLYLDPLPRPARLPIPADGCRPGAEVRGMGGADRPARPGRRRGGQAGEHVASRAASRRNGGMGGPARMARSAAVRLDEPAPGIAHIVPHPMGGQVYLTIRFYLYGDQAPAAVARVEPMWQAWMNEHFPLPAAVAV